VGSERQHTLAGPFTLRGVGLHTGSEASVSVAPAPVDAGYSFVLKDGSRIAATPDVVRSTVRCTALGSATAVVNTVEHVLAALAGMDVDNALITIEGDEVPILDGSALPFAQAIASSGVVEQSAARRMLDLRAPAWYCDADKLLVMLPAQRLSVTFFVEFPAPVGRQCISTGPITPDYFLREIAPNRTFGFRSEVESLMAAGLARGGSLDNAVVIDEHGYMGPLRFPDEIVRHKVLDLIGDLALVGRYPNCEVIALKSGHTLHVAAARELRGPLPAAIAH